MGGGPYYVPQLRDYGGFSPDAGRGGGVGKGLRISDFGFWIFDWGIKPRRRSG